jgi:hypothetical protein
MADDEDDAWRLAQRSVVREYLAGQGVEHGEIGHRPAWDLPPLVAIWAIESLKAPGWIGWWVISGDLPTDYCSAQGCRHPRLAMRRIAENWRDLVLRRREDETVLGDSGLPASLAPLLKTRVQTLLEIADDEEAWREEPTPPPSPSPESDRR